MLQELDVRFTCLHLKLASQPTDFEPTTEKRAAFRAWIFWSLKDRLVCYIKAVYASLLEVDAIKFLKMCTAIKSKRFYRTNSQVCNVDYINDKTS